MKPNNFYSTSEAERVIEEFKKRNTRLNNYLNMKFKKCKHKWKIIPLAMSTSPQPTMIVAVCEKCLEKRFL